MKKLLLVSATAIAFPMFVAGCGGNVSWSATSNPLVVGAGMSELLPEDVDTLSASLDLGHVGVPALDRVYELETPAAADFAFTIVMRAPGNAGPVLFSVAHAKAGAGVPSGGAESLAAAGLVLDGAGLGYRGTWVDVSGDGFARLTIRGRIDEAQVVVAEADGGSGPFRIGIRIGIGAPSVINVPADSLPDLPGVTSTTLYSSDSYQCGLPAIAVSGDRYSITAYDGSPVDPFDPVRQRIWLQYDAQTTTVTGGQAQSASPDSGSWRDQEIAASGNVLAVLYTGDGQVRADVSLDRGGSFPIQQVLDAAGPFWGQRLVQCAVAPDYTLACLYWRTTGTETAPRSELCLVEAAPTGFDVNNTPTGYAFPPPFVLWGLGEDVSPLLMSLVYTEGGDLVVGYGYSRVLPGPDPGTNLFQASYRCDTRLAGGTWRHTEIEHVDQVLPADPNVCVVGSGPALQIFYAYEMADGIHVRLSTNGGLSFLHLATAGSPGAMMPSIHARVSGEVLKLDVLFLDPAAAGYEVHDLRWADFYTTAPSVYRLTHATLDPTPSPPGSAPPGSGAPFAGMPGGFTATSVAWFGYDAVTDGDRIAVSVLESTTQSYAFFWMLGGGLVGVPGSGSGGSLPPPVLLPGMTGVVPVPDPTDRNQLKLFLID
jgi:hypothetical protein